MKNSTKGFAPIAIIVIVVAVLAAAGGGWYAYQKVKIKNQNGGQTVQQQAQTKDETADWNTCLSTRGNFKFRYPQNWKVYGFNTYEGGYDMPSCLSELDISVAPRGYVRKEGRNNDPIIFISNPIDTFIRSYDTDRKGVKSLDEYIAAYSKNETAYGIRSSKKINFENGNAFLILTGGMNSGFDILFERNGWIFTIELPASYIDSGILNLNSLSDTQQRIINSFEIVKGDTSTSSTASWKTYRNEKYGFEFKYPTDYTIGEDKYPLNVLKGDTGNSLFVYASSSAESLQNCYKFPVTDFVSGVGLTTKINGLEFRYQFTGDASMGGHRLIRADYHIIYNDTCYGIRTSMQYSESAQFFDYPSNTERQQAEERQGKSNILLVNNWKKMITDILSTFKFTK